MEISTLGEMGFEEKEPNATLAEVGSGILLVEPARAEMGKAEIKDDGARGEQG